MMNIVIPMAGAGSRFVAAGYKKPKPFIDVAGKPMIVRVLENLACPKANFYLIARKEHVEAERELAGKIQKEFKATFILIDKLTEGAVCTVLHARKYINNDLPLLLANSDQLVDIAFGDFAGDCFSRKLDGSIMTFIDRHRDPKWSFAKVDDNGFVTEAREKVAISQYATVGAYLYSKGRYFVDAAIDMLAANDRVNNEFYVCPTYNYAVGEGKKIGIYNINFEQMHGMGTPEDLNAYLRCLRGA